MVGGQREPTLKSLQSLYEITQVVAPEVDIQVKKGKAPLEPYDEQSEWNYQQRQLEEGAEAYVSLPFRNENGYPVSFELEVIARFKAQRQRWLVDGNLELIIDETDFGHLVGKVERRKSTKSLKEAVKLGKRFNQAITAFGDRYGWMFQSNEEVVEKLGAYFQSKKSGSCQD
jgi:hypothetical protein